MIHAMRRFGLAVAVLGLMGLTDRAEAVPITYTETATISGTLGATSFSNALVTITGLADTNNVIGGGTFFNVPVVATVTVAGVGSGTLTDIVQVFSGINGNPEAGFVAKKLASDPFFTILLDTRNAALTNYDLKSPIGPVTGAASISNPIGLKFGSTAGDFAITSVANGTSTFLATGGITAVPEPSTLTSAALASLMGLGYAWRRRRAD